MTGPDEGGLPSAEELFDPRPAASPADIRDAIRREMGEDVPARHPRNLEYPDVHQLARDIGLR